MVTIPNDHFGPIPAEHDPDRGQGVLVGEWWKDRLDCRQWGAHFPHVAGIAGQSGVGAQSVVLSGGYEDDRDEGEWVLYTGSGGRDLSGNKRTNKEQSFDQEFTNMNLALKLSCMKGLPVRVVRSFKEKRSSYAPTVDTPVRYDGIYRILSCWRKPGNQGPLVCRYLFVRCDNAPAPWSSAETGDDESLSIPSEAAKEIKQAKGTVFKMSDEPMWSYLEADGRWGWAKPAPSSNRLPGGGTSSATGQKRLRKKVSDHEKALKEFACGVCKEVCTAPLSTPCGHNFCKGCLDDKFEGISDIMAPTARTLRVRRNLKPCPRCNTDLCEFLSKAQVNHEMVGVIATLQQEVAKAKAEAAKLEAEGKAGDAGSGDDEDDDMAVEEACGGAGCSSGGAGSQAAAGGSADPSSSSDDTAAPVDKLPVPPAAAAAAAAAPAPAPAPAPPRYRYADELAQLVELFPGGDPVLMKDLLEDQGGDVADVSVMLKKMMAPARKHVAKKEKEAAPAKKAKEAAKIEEAASAKQVAVAAEAEEEAVAAEAEEDAALTTAVAAAENERLTGRTAAECAAAAAKPAPKKRGRPANKAAAAPSKKAETVCQADGAESEDPIQDASDTDVTPKKKKQRGRK